MSQDEHNENSSRLIDAAKRLQEKRRVVAAPVQLPLWPDEQRGIPNPFARSALFTAAGKKEPRDTMKRMRIATVNGFDLYYTGEELRQDDEDVFLQAVHIARLRSTEEGAKTTAHRMLMALRWGRGKQDYARLRESLLRLSESTVIVARADGRKGFTGSLLRKVKWSIDEDETGGGASTEWTIYLEREIVALFASDGYTLVDWDQRLVLTPLAKWLHSFYFTHREPFQYRVETLYGLCGSKCKELRSFRGLLKKALEKLKDCGFLSHWNIDPVSDVVSVIRVRALPKQ